MATWFTGRLSNKLEVYISLARALETILHYVDGKLFDASGVINLFSKAPDVGNVYNNIGLYGISSLDSSGTLHLYASGINTDTSSGVLNVTTSGSISGGTGILDFYGYGG